MTTQNVYFNTSGLAAIEEPRLIAAAKAGCDQAFVELYHRSLPGMKRSIRRIVRCREDVDDVIQEGLLNAYKHLGNFNQRSSFSTWITRIGINAALTLLRKQRRTREVGLIEEWDSSQTDIHDQRPHDSESDPLQKFLRSEQIDELNRAIDHLPPPIRSVIELTSISGNKTTDTVEFLQVSVPAVKSRALQGRRHLRYLLSEASFTGRSLRVEPPSRLPLTAVLT